MKADTYAWLVVFILPVNSAINPFLYTFTTPKFRVTVRDLCRRLTIDWTSVASSSVALTSLPSFVRSTASGVRSSSVSLRNPDCNSSQPNLAAG